MADETRKLQKDPPEGSRQTVEHELDRQSKTTSGSGEHSSKRREAERRGPGRGLR